MCLCVRLKRKKEGENMILDSLIKLLKEELNYHIEEFGLLDKKTITKSQQLDLLIVERQRYFNYE